MKSFLIFSCFILFLKIGFSQIKTSKKNENFAIGEATSRVIKVQQGGASKSFTYPYETVSHLTDQEIKILKIPIRSYTKVAIEDSNGYLKFIEVMKVVTSQKQIWQVYNPNKISYDKNGNGTTTAIGGTSSEKWIDHEWYYQDLAGNRVRDVYILIKHPN